MKPVQHKMPKRFIIYPRDIANFTGKSEWTARRLLIKLRLVLGKNEYELVSVQEFCEFYGVDEEMVNEFLNN